MKYYELFGLSAEPFSNSPDPEFFFPARKHIECLHRLEISLRLRRGLNIVLGEVGAGKSTLCRQLLKTLSSSEEIVPRLLLDPYFSSPVEFLSVLHELICGQPPSADSSEWEIKEAVKHQLFHLGVEQGKVVTLLMDEGQKIPEECLELLRELLNYETNTNKLLQIVIFAQSEFEWTINKFPNLVDRVNELYSLQPLNFMESVSLIRFRLKAAHDNSQQPALFSPLAYLAIYRATGGYPRKIITLCHKVMLALIIHKRKKATWSFVQTCARERSPVPSPQKSLHPFLQAAFILLLIGLGFAAHSFFQNKPPEYPAVTQKPQPEPDKSAVTESTDNKPAQKHDQKARGSAAAPDATPQKTSKTASGNSLPEHSAPQTGAPQKQPAAPTAAAPAQRKESASPQAAQTFSGPASLGELSMSPDDTLSNMLLKVYGAYREYYLPILAKANPHLENLHQIPDGAPIIFPTISASLPQNAHMPAWIRIGTAQTLSDGYAKSLSLSKDFIDIRLLPYWTPEAGLTFPLVISPPYPTKEAAQLALKTLPSFIQPSAVILSTWPEDVVFFSNVDFLLNQY